MSLQNPRRGYLTPDDLAIPNVPLKKRISLTTTTAGHQQFPINFKSVTISTNKALLVRFDFCDEIKASPGILTDATKDNIIPIPAGVTVWPFMYFVNTVSAVIADGTGTADVDLIPGDGKKSGLAGSGVDWDVVDYA